MKIEDYNEYYIQGSDHYLIPKDVFKELFNEMINWKEESQKKKEAIDKAIEYIEKFIPIDEDTILMRERQRDYLLDILNKEISKWRLTFIPC